MALDPRIAFAGIAKQSVKGTSIATPVFGLPLKGGNTLIPVLEQDRDDVTSTQPVSPLVVRNAAAWRQEITTRLFPKSTGLYLTGVLGSVSTSGSVNFTHTITPATTVPRYTFHSRLDTEYALVKDARVEKWAIEWSKAAPPIVTYALYGCAMTYGTSWTATNDESTQAFLPTAGGTFKIDAGSATAALADISGGKITFTRTIGRVDLSKQIEPDDLTASTLTMDVELMLTPADLSEWRKAITGTGAGTTTATNPTLGSFDETFTLDANTSLQIAATKVYFAGEYPAASPEGGAVELALVGQIVKPAGAAITCTLKNQYDGTGY